MPSQVRVQVLGPVRALAGNGPLQLRGVTARTVLARLALAAGSVVSADQLADALWHDDPPLEPSASLRSIVSRLRTQLGRDSIVTVGAGYRLDTARVGVDLADLEAALKGERLERRAPQELGDLLRLWDGPALADVAWTPAFEPERARIDELRARLLDAYHESMIEAGRAQETLADLERDATAASVRESTQLLLMRALDSCGRTADAVRAGDNYRTRLVEETGLDPSTAYEVLVQSLLVPDQLKVHQPSTDSASADTSPSPTPRPPQRTWIPPDTPFVGREAELEDLAQLVQQRRLVSIVGPGGVGKTRLVTEFVSSWITGTETNVDMVSLASLAPASEVDTLLATALGIEVLESSPLRAVTDRLSYRSSTLVLDNCEHVLPSVRLLVQHLLRSVEDLRIIITSRRRLGVADEAILDVGPLRLPPRNTVDNAPMQLFMDRVERTAPKLAVSEPDRIIAADICRLLEGLPLALELAAVRIPMFGFDGLRQRILDGLAVPGNSTSDDDRRQATIESTVAWSLDLLGSDARELFDDLTIFPSWFDLPSLQHISQSERTIDAFAEIHDSSLVVVDHERPAYRLLAPVRHVARRQIDSQRLAEITDRYLSWVDDLITRIEQHWLRDDSAAVQQLILEHRSDIRWALNRFVEQGDAASHGAVAKLLSRAFVERADLEIIALCRVDVGPSLEGALARLVLAWAQGDLDAAAQMVDHIGREIGPDHELWGDYSWAAIPVHLYRGDTDKVAAAAAVVAGDERNSAFMRAESVSLWACALLYDGRRDDAAGLMAAKKHILDLSDCHGFVAYTRAEIAATQDPELALAHLETSSQQAKAARNSFSQRLSDISRLVLLVEAGRSREAASLALRVVPELIQAGTYPHAWTAMRHVAELLGQLDEPATGLLALDSADAATSAPAVTGGAISDEDQLRRRLEMQAAASDLVPQPLLLQLLWERIEAILDAH